MFLDSLFYVISDLRWQLLFLLVAAISAAYALAAIWAVQSRDHWIIRGLVVCGLLVLLLPPRAYEPLFFFILMLPSLAALTAWQTWRRNSHAQKAASEKPFQFSLRVLLLGTALVASLLGLALAALRERPDVDWLRMPVAAVLIAVVANQAWRLVTSKRKVLQGLLLGATIMGWVMVEEFLLGDWLRMGNLFGVMHNAMLGTQLANILLLAIHYSEFSVLIFLGGAFAQTFFSPTISRRWRRICSVSAVALLIGIGTPLAWVYRQMLVVPQSMPPFAENDNCYPELQEFAIAAARGPLGEAKLRDLLSLLERPGAVSIDLNRDAAAAHSGGIMVNDVVVFRDLARLLQSAGDKSAQAGKHDEAAAYALANIRMGLVLQRGGLQIHFLVGNAIEGVGQSSLGKIRDKLSAAERQRLIGELQRVDHQREPVSQIEQRDSIFDDRTLRWRHRLEMVVLARSPPAGVETTYANFQRRSVTYSRLMMADLAVRAFVAEKGRFPKSLEELVPKYLATVPEDPFSGQPLRYRPMPLTFVLYSVGQDRQDNGGNFGNHVQSMFEDGYDLDIDTVQRPQP